MTKEWMETQMEINATTQEQIKLAQQKSDVIIKIIELLREKIEELETRIEELESK